MADQLYYANDKYRASLRATWIADPADTSLLVTAVPDKVPTIVTVGWKTDYETLFTVTGKSGDAPSNYALTGVSRLRGANVNLPENTAVNCLNHEEFQNQTFSLLSAISIDEDPSNLVEKTLDEDNMASNSATALATQQSIAAAIGGWLTAGISGVTVTRASIDDPTVVLTFDSDVTDYIWKGSRLKLDEGGTTHYMIVSKDPSYSSPNTTVTCLMEIDTATPTQAANPVSTGTITNVAYAPPKTYPKGFPIGSQSWIVEKISGQSSLATFSARTWYNLGGSLDVPIGDWNLEYETTGGFVYSGEIASDIGVTLSTANNTESDSLMTSIFKFLNTGVRPGENGSPSVTFIKKKIISLSSKTTYYLNIASERSSDQSVSQIFLGCNLFSLSYDANIIRATSTLL